MAVSLVHAQGPAVINRTAGRLHNIVLQDRRIDRRKHRPKSIRSGLPQIVISTTQNFQSAVDKIIAADAEIGGNLALDAEAALLAVWINDVRFHRVYYRRCDSRAKTESGDVGTGDLPRTEDPLLFEQAPNLRRCRIDAG